MAKRTLIPGTRLLANLLKKYLADHSAKLIENLGEGLYSVLVLIVDLCVLYVNMVDGNSDVNGNFDIEAPLMTLTSSQINSVQGAYVKWLSTNGIAEG
jgi:hypothetical protein